MEPPMSQQQMHSPNCFFMPAVIANGNHGGAGYSPYQEAMGDQQTAIRTHYCDTPTSFHTELVLNNTTLIDCPSNSNQLIHPSSEPLNLIHQSGNYEFLWHIESEVYRHQSDLNLGHISQ
ncbi:GRAB2 protein [Hordeum vulgare]|nr:GRAB2 protein [Hordeum vulgare]